MEKNEKKKAIDALHSKMTNLYGEETNLNDSITIKDQSVLEFTHSYKTNDTYLSKNLVTQFKIFTEKPEGEEKYSLSHIYNLSNTVLLNNMISCIFSNEVKFSTYQLKIYNYDDLTTPIFSTRRESIPGIYGKYPEPPYPDEFCISYKIKSASVDGEMPSLWYRDLYLGGIPKSLEEWDNPDNENDAPLAALHAFIEAFSSIKYKNIGIFCIGVNKGAKSEFLKSNLMREPRVVLYQRGL